MSEFYDGPCDPWPIIWCGELPVGATPEITGAAAEAASELLWARSGRRFGTCTVTFRPCRRDCFSQFGGVWPYRGWWEWGITYPMPVLYAGAWFNLTCGSCSGDCQCGILSEFKLPGPVAEIVEILIGGEVLPTGSYRVDDWRLVVRTDGALWPVCQDLSQADDGPDAWAVTVAIGERVPTAGQFAMGEVAAEYVKGCLGAPCKIPFRAVEVNRQGVVKRFPTPAELMKEGLLGLPFSDQFISTYNPNRLMAPPMAFDVDNRGPRRTGT